MCPCCAPCRSGHLSNVFPSVGSIAGSQHDSTGGSLYDLPIQPKAELPLQYLEYLVLVPMQMKRRCCVGSRSMFYQAKFVLRFLAWNCDHDFFQRIDLKRAGILDSLNKCDFVRLWCQAYSLLLSPLGNGNPYIPLLRCSELEHLARQVIPKWPQRQGREPLVARG